MSFWKVRLCASLMAVLKAAIGKDANSMARCQCRLRIQPKSGAKDCHLGWLFDIGGDVSSRPAAAGVLQ